MMRVRLICVGRLKERFYVEAAEEYVKRLGAYCKLEVVEIPEQRLPRLPSPGDIAGALEREGAAIQDRIPSGFTVVALCVEGQAKSSQELADALGRWAQSGGKGLALVIGGSYGLHPAVKAAAKLRLSMSPMTFPHHLARVMVLEQIYRAFQITAGTRYHK